MSQLTQEQKARIFAMYLGCRIKCVGGAFRANNNSLDRNGKLFLSPSILADLHEGTFWYADFRLLLTPLSKISDEDAIEVAKINGVSTSSPLQVGRSICHWLHTKGTNRDVTFEVYQYLISKGYAVPLFIAPNHPDNGKTAIDLGLALDKTEHP